ncbi:MAG: hypothetical protein ACK55Z_11420, partial [bacterium]
MIFQVKLQLALTAFEQCLSVFIFLGRTGAGVLFEAAIALFSGSIFPQRCELKINKLKIKSSIDIESCVDCNYNIGI